MIVVATNAPLSVHNLQRLSKRAIMGLARTGSFASNGSGDYVIAFTTDPALRVLRKYNVLETKRPASRYLFCRDYGSGL